MIVAQPREKIWAWMRDRIYIPWSEDLRTIALIRNDCIVAAIAYNGFNDGMCFMHSACDSPSYITKECLKAAFGYAFKQCNLKYVMATVNSNNFTAMKVNRKCGFKEVHRLKDAASAGGDIVFLQMGAADCRWLGE